MFGFVLCDTGMTGRALSENILQQCNLDLHLLRGQGYDGAGNMAGRYSGTAALIQRQYPLAVYTHCAAHVLNRHEALHTFAHMYGAIVETLDHISHCGSDEEVWDADSTSKAGGFLTVCLSFVFRMVFVVCKSCLSYVLDISRSLQKKAKDVCNAYSEVNTVIEALKEVRENVNDKSEKWFREAQEMAEPHNGPLHSVLRRCSRQTKRDNTPGDTPEEYFHHTFIIHSQLRSLMNCCDT